MIENQENTERYLLGRVLRETEKAFLFETAKWCVQCWVPRSVGRFEMYNAFEFTHLVIVPEWFYWKRPVLREGQHPAYMLTQHPDIEKGVIE